MNDYYNCLEKIGKKLDESYSCEFNAKKYSQEYNITSYTIRKVKSERSPMILFDFGDTGIFFAIPELIMDKYDKDAIINDCEKFELGETYNIKLLDSFLKEIKDGNKKV